MILLDTNIFIYLANGTLPAETLKNHHIAYASITKIEALGYSLITVAEQNYLEALLAECQQLELDQPTLLQAIHLRQQSKITLGDAIIAATALTANCLLWTANTADFAHIEELNLHNPVPKAQGNRI